MLIEKNLVSIKKKQHIFYPISTFMKQIKYRFNAQFNWEGYIERQFQLLLFEKHAITYISIFLLIDQLQ